MDYKRQQGIRYATPFRIYTSSQWNAAAVLRILKNPVYIGTLVQGRHTTPSYKVKKRVIKPKEQWAVFKGAHEAVIDPQAFAAVQRVLAMDIRTSGRGSPAELLSGMVYCKECGAPMVRKTVPSGGNTYVYYVCGAHKQKKCCSAHSIRAEALVDLVLDCLQKQIGSLGNARLSQLVREAARQKSTARKLRERIDDRLEEVCRLEKLLQSLYAGMADGLLSYAEYEEMKKEYTLLRTQAKLQAENMQIQLERELSDAADGSRWLHELKTKGSLPELDRAAVVFLVDRVFIGRGKQVRIVCLWNNA